MRRKPLQIAALVLALWMILGACAGNPAENTTPESSSPSGESTLSKMRLPEIPEDFFLVLCEENQDFAFTPRSCTYAISYKVLSAQPLTAENITVTLDQPIEFEVGFEVGEEPWTIPFEVWAAYQGVSWHELTSMLENKEEKAVAEKVIPMYETYSSIPDEELPCLYVGKLNLAFPDMGKLETTLHEMQIRFGEHTYTYALENLSFTQKYTDYPDSGSLSCDTVAYLGASLPLSEDGCFQTNKITLTAKEDASLDGLYFLDEEQCQVLSVDVCQPTASGDDIEYCWDMQSPIPLKKGDTITFTANCIDPLFANTLTANASRWLMLSYTSGGVESKLFVAYTFQMWTCPFAIYAERTDGLDILPYYTEYTPLNFDPYSV